MTTNEKQAPQKQNPLNPVYNRRLPLALYTTQWFLQHLGGGRKAAPGCSISQLVASLPNTLSLVASAGYFFILFMISKYINFEMARKYNALEIYI